MKKVSYLAVFEPCEEGYNVYFPDLPGCTSYGATFNEAQKQAVEALGLHLYGLEKDGDEIPTPSDKPEIDHDTAKGYLVSPISVFTDLVKSELDNRRIPINITIPAWLKREAEARGVNYSQILEAALLEYLG